MITLIVSAVVLVTLVGMYFTYNNREVSLRKEAEAQKGKIESVYDTMWKTLKQEAGVTEQYRKTFEEIYPKLIAGRYSGDGKELIKMIQNRYEGVQIIIIIGDRLSTDYEKATIAIAKHFGLPYVNFVGVTIDKCSGSHPTAPAFDKMASMIYEQCIDYLP